MKKHLSVFRLMTATTFPRFAAALLVMITAEGILFWISLINALTLVQKNGRYTALDTVISQSHITWTCMAAFIACAVVLCMVNTYKNTRNILNRLIVSQETVFVWQAICNAGCWLMFWGVQVGIVLVFSGFYMNSMDSGVLTGQTVLFAFYRDGFLRNLLPLSNILLCVRNVLLAVAMGLVCAFFSRCLRQEKQKGLALFHLLLLLLLVFGLSTTDFDPGMTIWLQLVLFLVFCAEILYQVFGRNKIFRALRNNVVQKGEGIESKI